MQRGREDLDAGKGAVGYSGLHREIIGISTEATRPTMTLGLVFKVK